MRCNLSEKAILPRLAQSFQCRRLVAPPGPVSFKTTTDRTKNTMTRNSRSHGVWDTRSARAGKLAASARSLPVALSTFACRLGPQDQLAQPQQLGIANAEWLSISRHTNSGSCRLLPFHTPAPCRIQEARLIALKVNTRCMRDYLNWLLGRINERSELSLMLAQSVKSGNSVL